MTRIGPTLEELGITSAPEATLSREDAFFVLVDDLLIYRDARILRRVSLRDLTRIHSDDSGTLRVETPAGTALSASLLGFDPDEVQPFFLRVRDATAYAKAQAKRAQERERGEAPPSPFARVPRAQPGEAPGYEGTAGVPPQPTEGFQPTEEFEPYAPYEQPRTLASRLGSAVRVIKRPSEAPRPATERGERPADTGQSRPDAATRPVTPAPQPSPPSPPSPAPRPAPRSGPAPQPASVSMEEALRAAPAESQPAAQPTPAQPAGLGQPTRPARSRPTDQTPADRPASSAASASAPQPTAPAPQLPVPPGRESRLDPAGLPNLRVWPPRLRLMAGLLLLTALVLTGYYLLNGMVAAGLWLLVAGAAGTLFLLAMADTVQVLAARLDVPPPREPEPGSANAAGAPPALKSPG
ncbi:MAG: hypothetical protein Q4C67_03525 [Deinococcus sp.]|nr:hypothetical protein [Deinococcus sp.]